MTRRVVNRELLLTAVTGTTVSAAIDVADYRNSVISVGGSGSQNWKLFFKGAIGQVAPDFSANKTRTNQWEYIDIVDLEDGASIDGDTGLALTAPDVRLFEVNVNSLDWFAVHLTAVVSAGTLTCTGSFTTNE